MHLVVLQVFGWISDVTVAQNLKDFKLIMELMISYMLGEWHLHSCKEFANHSGFVLFLPFHGRASHRQFRQGLVYFLLLTGYQLIMLISFRLILFFMRIFLIATL